MQAIVFEQVNKFYGKTQVVKDLNLTVNPGERLILLGPSGCGKSTTLRMIAGLEEISAGKLFMAGKLVNAIPSGDRGVAMVFQNYALFPHMTVAENISYGLKVQKLPKEEILRRLRRAVAMLHLEGLEERKPKELSGGQRQRVALARAVVKRAPFFLLDEPLSNLDAQLRVHARKELVKIHEMDHQTFVYVTHDQVEAMTIGHRIALMYRGELQMVDTPHRVYNRPANVFTAKFIGSPATNIMAVKYENRALEIGEQALSLPDNWLRQVNTSGVSQLFWGIRPEHIRLEYKAEIGALAGTVRTVEDYGNRYGVYLDVSSHEMVAICEENAPQPGETVWFRPDFSKIHLFNGQTGCSIGYPDGV